jgi:tripartite-type tricarboxylate transporter receptor subunit TctC
MLKKSSFGGALAFSVLFACSALAQNFPTKPITLVIPVGAGGSHDLTGRAVTSVAANYLGQPILIQLKPGGGGSIGSDFVAASDPDGYTLLLGGPQWSSTIPAIDGKSKGPDDLVAVCRINYSPMIVGVRSGTPYKDFKQMIAWCKSNPGKLLVGGTGMWSKSEMLWQQMNSYYGIKVKKIPYNGGGPALTAMLGGHIDTTVGLGSVFAPYIAAGKMWGAAVLDNKREKALSDVPTAKEMGVNAIHIMWRGVLAPKGTPRAIVEKLAAGFKKMTEDPAVISMISQLGDEIQYLGPDEFAKVWRTEYELDKELGRKLKEEKP